MLGMNSANFLGRNFGKLVSLRVLVVWEAGDSGPGRVVRSAQQTEDFENLVDFAITLEKRLAYQHFG